MNFYRDITFAAPSTGLTNFPALVRIQNDRMKKRISSPNGFDVSFQQIGTDIPFELDFYDSSTGSGAWWVKIPTLPANKPTTIRMVYGDSNISTDPSSPSTVWSDYLAVYHFNEIDPGKQFNSAGGVYGTWSNSTAQDRAVSFTSGGVTGRMLSVNDLFTWNSTPKITCPCSNARGDIVNFSVVYKVSPQFNYSTGACLIRTGNSQLTNDRHSVYSGDITRQTPLAEGTLAYMNTSWRSSDNQVVWQTNDTFETGSMTSQWIVAPSDVTCLYCYSGAANSVRATFQIDELRVSNRFVTQAETSYENNILTHHSQYVTYGLEYHTDGTPVVDFLPWTRQPIFLD